MGWGSVGPRWSAFSAAAACSRRDTKFRKNGDLNIMIRITINLIDLFSTMGCFSRKNIIHRINKMFKMQYLFTEVLSHRSIDPFYIVSYCMKWVTTSWTHSKKNLIKLSIAFICFLIIKYIAKVMNDFNKCLNICFF